MRDPSAAEPTHVLPLSRMRHDLRTPIATILGLAQILQSELTDEEHKEDLEFIISNARALQTMIDDFVTIVRDRTDGPPYERE